MDRSKKKDYEWLKEKGTNAYDCLGIEQSASFDIIKKAYRKNALLLHPDKNHNVNSDELFRAVNVSYQILSDPESRKLYDQELNKHTPVSEDNANVAKFKSELKNREEIFQNEKDTETRRKLKVEMLSKWYDDYVRNENKIHLSTATLNFKKLTIFPRTIQLKWKNNPSVVFDEELISKLIGVFAIPKKIEISKENNPQDRYHYAILEFESPIAAAILAKHDFSITQNHWDSLKLRKTASLLRNAKLVGYDNISEDQIDYVNLSHLDYIAFSYLKSQI